MMHVYSRSIIALIVVASLLVNVYLLCIKHEVEWRPTMSRLSTETSSNQDNGVKDSRSKEKRNSHGVDNRSVTTTAPSFNDNKVFLLVMVVTAPKNSELRTAIRDTWRNSYVTEGKKFTVKFVIGTFNLSTELTQRILEENNKHNDLVLLEDHLDSYNTLTRKVLQMFVWADKNINFSYMFKTDDDCFPRLDAIESELREHPPPQPLYWGSISKNSPVHSDGKWKEDKWSLCKTYIAYAYGIGYVLSSDLVHRIAINADGLVLYNNEDVSVAVWVSPFVQKGKDDPRFNPLNKCNNKNIVQHSYNVAALKRTHSLLLNKQVFC